MARDTRRAFFELVAGMQPALREAFLAAFLDIRSSARLTAVVAAVERGDVTEAIVALNLRDEFFAPLDRQIENAFYQGGVYQLARLPEKPKALGGPVVVRFSGRNPDAEREARAQAGALIQEITEDQRRLARDVIEAGIAEGRNPRSVALDLVGRTVRGKNERTGGLIGLHSQQAGYVQGMRAQLRDPAQMGGYFSRKLRDKRFDRIVRDAQRAGRPVSAADVERIAARYADRLLVHRGERIGRTEAIRALNAGRYAAVEQLIESGDMPAGAVRHEWSATMDARTRDLHIVMDGQEIRHGQAFRSPTGALLRYPGDVGLGALAEDVINCRCYSQIKIDWLSQAV